MIGNSGSKVECDYTSVPQVPILRKPRQSSAHGTPAGVPSAAAAQFALDEDLGEMFDKAEVVRERRPAKMVTALRLDLDTQADLEAAASARGIGSSTLMRQIIEEWVAAHRDTPPPNQPGELVRHLDVGRQAAASLAQDPAA
jgi:hypothetical protein